MVTEVHSSEQPCVKFKGYSSFPIDERIMYVLQQDYVQGFRFDDTTLGLLATKAQYSADHYTPRFLERRMYRRRDDGLYFLNESVATTDLCLRIAEYVNVALKKFKCFELETLYKRFSEELNPVCIRNTEDFEDWFSKYFAGKIKTRKYGAHRIVRVNYLSQDDATLALVRSIIEEIQKSFGTMEEERLSMIFDAFSVELLNELVLKEIEGVNVCQINGRTCYQAFYVLGLPDDFPENLSKALDKIDELELKPNLETIHILLSATFKYNFKKYFNIPDDETCCRLIEFYYQGTPREWKAGVFQKIEDDRRNLPKKATLEQLQAFIVTKLNEFKDCVCSHDKSYDDKKKIKRRIKKEVLDGLTRLDLDQYGWSVSYNARNILRRPGQLFRYDGLRRLLDSVQSEIEYQDSDENIANEKFEPVQLSLKELESFVAGKLEEYRVTKYNPADINRIRDDVLDFFSILDVDKYWFSWSIERILRRPAQCFGIYGGLDSLLYRIQEELEEFDDYSSEEDSNVENESEE